MKNRGKLKDHKSSIRPVTETFFTLLPRNGPIFLPRLPKVSPTTGPNVYLLDAMSPKMTGNKVKQNTCY